MNYKQLKVFAMCCMVFDHAVRIFPLGQIFAPLADLLWSKGYEGLADWLLGDCILYIMYIGRLAAPIFIYLLHCPGLCPYFQCPPLCGPHPPDGGDRAGPLYAV